MTSTTERAEADAARILPHHTYLILGYVFAAVAVGSWLVQILIRPYPVLDGLFEILRVAAVVAALGYFAHRVSHRVCHRLDQMEQREGATPSRRAGRTYVSRVAQESVGIAPVDADTLVSQLAPSGAVVAPLPEPEVLRAARRLANKVITSEQRRVEDNPEDTPGMRM